MSKDEFEEIAPNEEDPAGQPQLDYDPAKISIQDNVDLRAEVFTQIHLLKAIRSHLFDATGKPKLGIEFKDIRAYMTSSTQLLTMLQKFEEVLKTDADFGRVELALEKAMEECASTEFVALLKGYLAEGEAEAA